MFRMLLSVLAATIMAGQLALAEELSQPQGDVILTISGAVLSRNSADGAEFDLEMLRALDSTEIKTTTIWTDGTQLFEGVALDVLVKRLGIEGGTLRATAINDYSVEIPVSDAVAGGPIIAYALNGEAMSIRDKGPLWIIYPYDSSSEYRSEVVYSRSIWQLDRIEAVN
jgi:hypothetical protein